jgi:hypothetical protein
MLRVASVTCALCAVAILLSAPYEVAAKAGGAGFGAHPFFSHRPMLSRRPFTNHRAFRGFPWLGGGFVSTYPYFEPDYVNGTPPTDVVYSVPQPPRALNCHRSIETLTVPSEDNGTREIKITRC